MDNINDTSTIEPFVQSSFDPFEYINGLYRPNDSLTQIHDKTSVALATVERSTQDSLTKLESSIDELTRTTNRLSYEIEVLNVEAENLVIGTEHFVTERNAREELSKHECYEKLASLESKREHLEQVIELLSKAQKWNTKGDIIKDLDLYLETGDIAKARELVDDSEGLVRCWNGTREEASRKEIVNTMRRKLVQQDRTATPSALSSMKHLEIAPDSSRSSMDIASSRPSVDSDRALNFFETFTKRVNP